MNIISFFTINLKKIILFLFRNYCLLIHYLIQLQFVYFLYSQSLRSLFVYLFAESFYEFYDTLLLFVYLICSHSLYKL